MIRKFGEVINQRNLVPFMSALSGLATLAHKLPPTSATIPVLKLLQQSLHKKLDMITSVDLIISTQSFNNAHILDADYQQSALKALNSKASTFEEKTYSKYVNLLLELPSFTPSMINEAEVLQRLTQPQNIIDLLIGYSTRGLNTKLYDDFEPVLRAQVHSINTFRLSQIAKVYAIRRMNSKFLDDILRIVTDQALTDKMAFTQIVRSLTACGKNIEPIAGKIENLQIELLTVGELASLYEGLSKASSFNPKFIARLEQRLIDSQAELNGQMVATLFNAIAQGASHNLIPLLLSKVRSSDQIRDQIFKSQYNLTKVLHALAKYRTGSDVFKLLVPDEVTFLSSDSAAILAISICKSNEALPEKLISQINFSQINSKRTMNLGYYMSKPNYFKKEFWTAFKPHFVKSIQSAWDVNSMMITNTIKNLKRKGIVLDKEINKGS